VCSYPLDRRDCAEISEGRASGSAAISNWDFQSPHSMTSSALSEDRLRHEAIPWLQQQPLSQANSWLELLMRNAPWHISLDNTCSRRVRPVTPAALLMWAKADEQRRGWPRVINGEPRADLVATPTRSKCVDSAPLIGPARCVRVAMSPMEIRQSVCDSRLRTGPNG